MLRSWKPRLDQCCAGANVAAIGEAGRELMEELRDGAEGGVPWFAILDAQGKVMATSNDPKTKQNIGFPSDESSQLHFASMLNATRQRLSEEDVKEFVGILADKEVDR